MIIDLTFHQNCNFLATHVDARSSNGDFLLSSVERTFASRARKIDDGTKVKSKKIDGFKKSLSEHGPVCTWIVFFLKVDSEYELENIDFKFFENLNLIFL